MDDEIVREMLISNFSHFGVFVFENPGAKVQHYKNDRSLLGQSHRPMLRIRISRKIAIDVIVFECVGKSFNKPAINLES
jgi:hypothetical protein